MKLFIPIALLIVGCSTLNSASPLPCREIADVPGLHEEILKNRDRDNLLNQLNLEPYSEKLRDYALESSAKCHGNNKLR